ncbi:MAG TPA: aminoacyl-tRNA hydrolase [Bacteroidales bacterium]|nr:aminoacyl-tRNA hydrolase [Bacteroidales bacterium]HPS46788.1 aminoacyl-tRNA hydrolase [Bacteroidales bacterium]HQH18427.1 aminoacyl-tRNA hydrolase [Bacteroidales bacterium]HQI46465.1 aminoacyl-tRNA hydrolase [Bacteroidales bacterium]
MKFLIAGLGNIGPEYEETRHNIGFMALDSLAKKLEIRFESKRYADVAEFRYKGRIFILIKPSTFMNLSGKAISYWLKKEAIPDENLLVITDDIALPIGTLRLRKKGGAGGHNGLTNIIELLGNDQFPRLRIGIGNEFPIGYQIKYVLNKWSNDEKELLTPKLDVAGEIIKSFGTIGIDLTMNKFNKK